MALGVVDHSVRDPQRGRHREHGARGREPLLERSRDRDRLERGARLVARTHRPVLPRVGGRVSEVLCVDRRPVCQRQDVAVPRIQDHGGRALRLVGLPHAVEHGLRSLLDRAVDREADVVARGRRLDVDDAHRLADRVADHAAPPVGAVQLALARCRPGRTRRCRPHRPAATRAPRAGSAAAARWSRRRRGSSASARRRPCSCRSDGRGRRTRGPTASARAAPRARAVRSPALSGWPRPRGRGRGEDWRRRWRSPRRRRARRRFGR